jgi:hypothetical protein
MGDGFGVKTRDASDVQGNSECIAAIPTVGRL